VNIILVLVLFFALSLGVNVYQFNLLQNTSTFQIEKVIDGDSLILDGNGIHVRLKNVEAPEIGNCGADQAKKRLQELVEGKKVKVEFSGEDTYNRSLVFLFQNNTLINKVLMEEGLVRYDGTPSTYRDSLRDAHQSAVSAKKGIYGPPCLSEKPDDPKCLIKGNIDKSGKEKGVYFLPGCSEYNRTPIEKDIGDKWFCTESQAQKEGFVKATHCP